MARSMMTPPTSTPRQSGGDMIEFLFKVVAPPLNARRGVFVRERAIEAADAGAVVRDGGRNGAPVPVLGFLAAPGPGIGLRSGQSAPGGALQTTESSNLPAVRATLTPSHRGICANPGNNARLQVCSLAHREATARCKGRDRPCRRLPVRPRRLAAFLPPPSGIDRAGFTHFAGRLPCRLPPFRQSSLSGPGSSARPSSMRRCAGALRPGRSTITG